MPTPCDPAPDYAAPIGKAEERRLRHRAQGRLLKLNGRLANYDADVLLALHGAIDRFYADTIDERAADAPEPPRQPVTE